MKRETTWPYAVVRAFGLVSILLLGSIAAQAQPNAPGLQTPPALPSTALPGPLRDVGFEQRLNHPLPLDLLFRDEDGREVRLAQYFGQRPVVLTFVYYECPMLCTQVLNGLLSAMRVVDQSVGSDFDVVTVSFDPRETPVLASGKKKAYLDRYDRADAAAGWHFLTGSEASIAALTHAAGFHYAWDPESTQFAHASGIMIVTPDGRLSRYLFGIDFAPRDLKFALMESSQGKIGSLADQLLLYCYHYDPRTGSYSLVAMNTVRIGGAVTVMGLLGFVVMTLRRERRANR